MLYTSCRGAKRATTAIILLDMSPYNSKLAGRALEVADLEPGLGHPDAEVLGFVAARDAGSVVGGQHHDRAAAQPRLEYALAAHVHVVGVDQGEHGVGPLSER